MESTSTLDEARPDRARETVMRLLTDAKRTSDIRRRRELIDRALRLAVSAERLARGW